MKNIILTTLLALSALLSANSQTFEGEITYKITYTDLPAEAEMYKAMLPVKSVVVMKNEKSMTEQNTMGIINIKMINNSKTKKSAMLMDMMGKKIVMEDNVESEDVKSNFEVIKQSETKMIAGYKCNKAIIKNGEGNEVVYWYTTSLPGYKGKNIPNIDLEGFPMEFSINQEAMSMKMTVTTVEKKAVNDSVFEIPADYEKKTKEEMQDLLKGMGGM